MLSSAANASATVLCSLCTVLCRPLSGPHGCTTQKVIADCVTFFVVVWRSFLYRAQTCPQLPQA